MQRYTLTLKDANINWTFRCTKWSKGNKIAYKVL